METTKELKLGQTLRDATSGFTGIAIQKMENLAGNIQYALQPQTKTGDSYPEAMFLDHHMLDYVDDGVMARVTEVTEVDKFKLGERVKDKVSGFEGIAVAKATYLNGCVSFVVIPKVQSGTLFNEAPKENYLSSVRLERVDEGVNKTVTPPPPAASGKTPGGPAQRVQRSCN